MRWMEQYTCNSNRHGDWDQEESDWAGQIHQRLIVLHTCVQARPQLAKNTFLLANTFPQHSQDSTLVKPDGTTRNGNAQSFKEYKSMNQRFTSEFHEPYFRVTRETKDGWEMIGQAYFFANLPGEPTAQEKKGQELARTRVRCEVPECFPLGICETRWCVALWDCAQADRDYER